MLVTDQQVLREFLWARIQESHGPGSVLMGWAREGRIVAALSFSRISDRNCEVGIYSEGILPRNLLLVGFRYVFVQLALARLTFCVRSTNLPSIQLVSALGAELEATLTGTFSDGDTLIWRLTPDRCRFWRKLNEQWRQGRTRAGST